MSGIAAGVLALLLGLAGLAGQAPPLVPESAIRESRATARNGAAKPIIENERVTVWDVAWKKGMASPLRRADEDLLLVYLAPNPGHVIFQPKGLVSAEEQVPDGTLLLARLIALHDRLVAPRRNTSGYPNAFPRAGAKIVFDNARVTVWDYTFSAGAPSPMHFHDKDVVVSYIGEGALLSTTPEGQTQTNAYVFGDTRFNLGDRTHTELLQRGQLRILATELK